MEVLFQDQCLLIRFINITTILFFFKELCGVVKEV